MLFTDPDAVSINRCTCSQALQMAYFKNSPYPAPRGSLPLPEAVRLKYMDPAEAAAAQKRKNPRMAVI